MVRQSTAAYKWGIMSNTGALEHNQLKWELKKNKKQRTLRDQ
jgi:hypothetical protein